MDFLTKDFVASWYYTNIDEYREMEKKDVNPFNGRTYLKLGKACATTCVADVYKVWDPSVNQYKYVVFVGTARQHPSDLHISKSEGIEIARTNAETNPAMVLYYTNKPEKNFVINVMREYVWSLPLQIVKTGKEIKTDKIVDDYMEQAQYEELRFKTKNQWFNTHSLVKPKNEKTQKEKALEDAWVALGEAINIFRKSVHGDC